MPSSANAWSNLGGALQMEGDFSKALEAYDHSLQLEPSKDAYSNLATSYFYLGRFAEAVANYERAAALGEHDYVIQGNLADALWQVEGRRDEAVARYRRAILLAETELEATPADADVAGAAGVLLRSRRRPGPVQRYLSEALARGPEMLYVQYFVGVSAADRGDRETALRAVSRTGPAGIPAGAVAFRAGVPQSAAGRRVQEDHRRRAERTHPAAHCRANCSTRSKGDEEMAKILKFVVHCGLVLACIVGSAADVRPPGAGDGEPSYADFGIAFAPDVPRGNPRS